MARNLTDLANQVGQRAPMNTEERYSFGSANYFAGFAESTLAGITGLVGVDPSHRVEQFREENPVSGFVSENVGLLTPYLGWARATRGVASLAKLGNMRRAPMLTSASREALRFAPMELGRIGGAAALGNDVGEVAESAALNTGFAFVGGAAYGALKAAGRVVQRGPEIAQEVDLRAPLTLQLRQLRDAVAAGTVQNVEAAERHVAQLSRYVRAERPKEITRTVGRIAGDEADESTRFLNRVFKHDEAGGTKHWRRSRFVEGAVFESEGAWQNAFAKAGLRGREHLVQFPQYVKGTSSTGARNLHRGFMQSMSAKVGPDTWLAREADDGLYVMAKRISKTDDVRPHSAGDEWVVFKTDRPGEFAPEAKQFADAVLGRNEWLWPTQKIRKPIGAAAHDSVLQLMDDLPLHNFLDTELQGIGKLTQQAAERLPEGMRRGGQLLSDFTRHYLTPAGFQFTNSPRAHRLHSIARIVKDDANAKAQAIMFGQSSLQGEGKLVRSFFTTTATEAKDNIPIKPLIDALSDTDMDVIHRAWLHRWTNKAIQRAYNSGNISDEAFNFLKVTDEVDGVQFDELTKTLRSVGQEVPRALQGHRMISRTWRGTLRSPIYDEAGNRVWMSAGNNAGEVAAEADDIIAAAAKEGKKWTQGDTYPSSPSMDMEAMLSGMTKDLIAVDTPEFLLAAAVRDRRLRSLGRPGTFKERRGMRGFVGDKGRWSKQELQDIMFTQVKRYQNHMADVSTRNLLADDLWKLQQESPSAWTMLNERLNQLAGRQGAASKIQNQVADRLLGPVMGGESASKLVGALNSTVFRLQLGMGNLMFPALNATTFLQTTMPQIAFVMDAPLEITQRYYTMFGARGADQKVKASIGALDMMKLAGRSFKELGRPSAHLVDDFERALREGVIDPRFVEEYVGQSSTSVTRLKKAFEDGGIMRLVTEMSDYLPGASEKFSRGHTFVTGHIVGRDLQGLRGEELFRFAREFTNNSMFLYSSADRANAITGPVGSFFGLFKNWMMNQLGWTLQYAGLGLNHNKWGPLLWAMAGTGAVGGAGAVPGMAVADWIARNATDKNLQELLYANFSEDGDDSLLADAIYYGLPATLGLSLQGSASAPLADPVRDANMFFSVVHWNRMKAVGDAAGGAIDRYRATGDHPANDARVRDALVRAFAPRSMNRAMALTQGEMVRSMTTGHPQVSLSPGERFAYAAGFNPINLDRAYAAQSELWRDQDQLRGRIATLGQAWADALQQGRTHRLDDITRDAMRLGVPLDSVIRSANSRAAKARENMFERQFSASQIAELRPVIGPNL